jgi:site-specific recombinase XerD
VKGDEAVSAYIADLEARRYSLSRRSHSEYTLALVAGWLSEVRGLTEWREVTENHLRGFLIYAERDHRSPQDKPISASTRKQWLTLIRSFIQRLLGHDKLETTERYTHLMTEDLKAAITAAHEIIAAKIARD